MTSIRRSRAFLITALCSGFGVGLWGCSDSGGDDGGPTPIGGGGGAGGAGGNAGQRDAAMGRPDFAVEPMTDAAVGQPDAMMGGAGGGAPDAMVGEPDMGMMGEPDMDPGPRPDGPLVASIVLARTPGEDSTITVSITEPVELGNSPGCVVANVNPDQAVPDLQGYHGGEITVTGPSGGPYTFTPTGDAQAGFEYTTNQAPPEGLFIEGTQIQVEGAGGPHFGAFSAALTAPGTVNVQAPPAFGHSQTNAEALDVRWIPGNGDTLLITLIPMGGDPFAPEPIAGDWAFCAVDDSGSFSVPAATVAQVVSRPGPLGSPLLVGLSRTRVATTPAEGQDEVAVSAIANGGALVTIEQ